MCGILISNSLSREEIENGLKQMASRGPDHREITEWDNWIVGYNRLAISDTVEGNQPLRSLDGTVDLVFNGAIYNAEQVMDYYKTPARSRNDGEAIILLYKEHGLDFANYLEGMFSLCLYDRNKEELIIARDKMGIKPLLFAADGDSFTVSSTLPACPSRVQESLRMFPPGKTFSVKLETYIENRCEVQNIPFEEALVKAVKRRIPKEVPWGIMLSGGIDSSCIAAIATTEISESVIAYTLDFNRSPDATEAQKTAALLNLDHRIVTCSEELVTKACETVIRFCGLYDSGIIVNAVATYLVCSAAREDGIKVLLSGEGADELLAGYEEFDAIADENLQEVLLDWQADLGTSECFRLDIGAMAASIEARVPFLDANVVYAARALPVWRKRKYVNGHSISKVELREIFSGRLPPSVITSPKIPFHKGSGLVEIFKKLADAEISSSSLYREPLDEYFFRIWKKLRLSVPSSPKQLRARGLWRKF